MRIQSRRRDGATPSPTVDNETAPKPVAPVSNAAGQRLGNLLIEAQLLTPQQAEQVHRAQRASDARFGETAVNLGFVSATSVDWALAQQFSFSIAPGGGSRLDPSLVTATGARDAPSEQIRQLRATLWSELAVGSDERGPRTVAIVSSTAGVGRRVIAANLAIAFAQSGARTLLVDGDLREPKMHQLFDVPNQSGLSTFLARRQVHPTIVPISEIADLAVHPAGPIPPNPAELLTRLADLLPEIAAAWQAQLVLINTPPISDCHDAFEISVAAGTTVVVARRNATRTRDLFAMRRRLDEANVRIAGAILNAA
jgi:receptor protein-tyrosine kinase